MPAGCPDRGGWQDQPWHGHRRSEDQRVAPAVRTGQPVRQEPPHDRAEDEE